jgi:glutamyl-tRNA synthetase
VKRVRVRFAPSPTGHLHIGGLRTALFNWLFARHHNGTFLLRVEDTDRERSRREYVDSQLESLFWAGIHSDEPLVFQSERMALYEKFIQQLLDEKKAYRCFCPGVQEEVEFKQYNGACRDLPFTPANLQKPHAIRIKFPRDHATISFHDLIRGDVTFSVDQYDDFIIARSDGTPVYNFVVVIDDAAMEISHVIRGEDHISNTPRQMVIYQALGFQMPQFAHIPLVLGPSGQRLSKREAATGVLEYRKNGYLAEALCNYLVRLGWSHGDQEIFTRPELIDLFSLADVGKSGAIFDIAKLNWMNGHYIRQTSNKDILKFLLSDIDADFLEHLSTWPESMILDALGLWKERVSTLQELRTELITVHNNTRRPAKEEYAKWITSASSLHLHAIIILLEQSYEFSSDSLSGLLKKYAEEENIKFVQLAQPIRLALIGTANGPGVFELLLLFGKDESINRIRHFLSMIELYKNNP